MSKNHKISLLLTPGDSEHLIGIIYGYWHKRGGAFPTLIAQEPGPLDLAAGLRVLPNEVLPETGRADILIISNLGKLQVDNHLLALVRRSLLEGTLIWVVGPFPESLLEVALEPGWEIKRVTLEELGDELEKTKKGNDPLQSFPTLKP